MSNENSTATSATSIGTKLVAVIALTIFLTFLSFPIILLIHEREKIREEAINEVSSKWGSQQTIAGPILSVPYTEQNVEPNSNIIKYAHFLPASLNIEGKIDPQLRRRGIYEVVVYNAKLKVNGEFSLPDFTGLAMVDKNIFWDDAFISLGISDLSGIQEPIKVQWNGQESLFVPGIRNSDNYNSGISAKAVVNRLAPSSRYPFSFDLNLNGSRLLNFIPAGKETKVKLDSGWASPSFNGAFLPDNHNLNDQGFAVDWKILDLNRNLPQSWLGEAKEKINDSAFGVELLIPVDQYQKSMRTIKYAILLIGLTFLVFFFVEAFNKRRIHPVQYLLVGAALCIFYLLLLSISEHLNFDWAYIISGLATILLITIYSKHIFKNIKLSLLQGLILALLYTFVYIIIQSEDYALLMGSIGIFVVLAAVMFISRKINWYGAGHKSNGS